MQKGSALLLSLIVVFVVIVSIVYYYASQSKISSDEKISPVGKVENNLKTYTNSQLGFEFKYPGKNLEVQEDSEEEFNKRGNGDFRKNFTYYVTYPPANVLGAVSVLDETKSYELNPLTIWVFENPNNLIIDKWYTNFWYYPFVWGDYTERKNSVAPVNIATVSGQLAKFGVVTYREGNPKFIYLTKNEKMYLIRIIEDPEKVSEQILENFKLLD